MAKNMTRKGLGLGAVLSLLAATFVAAAPAQATTVTLDPKTGTEYRVPISETFTLASRYGEGANVFADKLEVLVKDADQDLAGVSFNGVAASYDADLDAWKGILASVGTVGTYYDVVLTPSTSDATFSVTVQTGFDLSAAGVFGGTKSPEREVFFHVAADYSWNLTFDAPKLGDTKLTASVTTTPALNLAQIASAVEVGFGTSATNGNLTAVGNSTISGDNVRFNNGESTTYSATDVDLSAEATHTVAAGTYVAALVLNNAQVGSLSYRVVAAATVTTINDAALAEGADVVESSTANTYNVRTGATSIVWSATATDGTDPVAGAVFTVTIEDVGTLSDDASISAGGQTLTKADTDGKISFDVTADADGVATVTVTLSGSEAATDGFTIDAKSENVSATPTVTVDMTATSHASLVDHNLMGTNGIFKVEKGSSYTLRFAALDNFGQPLTGDYRVLLTGGKAAVDAPVVNGVATFNLTDDADTNEAYTAALQEYNKTSRAYVAVSPARTATITPVVGASNAAAKVTVVAADDGSTTAVALNTKDAAAANTRLGEAAPAPTGGTTLSGQVTDANGVGTYSMVTVSLDGAQFKVAAAGGDVWTVGSATVMTNATGAWSGVTVYSNIAGKVTVSANAGSVSADEEITFAQAAAAAGTTLVIDAPYVVEPGSTWTATATLTDKYGNPVDTANTGGANPTFTLSAVSPGFQVGSDADQTDAKGQGKIGYFLGNNDKGTITVTATYDADGTATAKSAISTQFTIVIGTLGNTGDLNTWTSNKGDGLVKVYAKNIVGAGKVQIFFNGKEIAWVNAVDADDPKLRTVRGSAYLVRSVNLVEGMKNVIEIYVDGERTTRTAYTY